jgi:hypothetical protein
MAPTPAASTATVLPRVPHGLNRAELRVITRDFLESEPIWGVDETERVKAIVGAVDARSLYEDRYVQDPNDKPHGVVSWADTPEDFKERMRASFPDAGKISRARDTPMPAEYASSIPYQLPVGHTHTYLRIPARPERRGALAPPHDRARDEDGLHSAPTYDQCENFLTPAFLRWRVRPATAEQTAFDLVRDLTHSTSVSLRFVQVLGSTDANGALIVDADHVPYERDPNTGRALPTVRFAFALDGTDEYWCVIDTIECGPCTAKKPLAGLTYAEDASNETMRGTIVRPVFYFYCRCGCGK